MTLLRVGVALALAGGAAAVQAQNARPGNPLDQLPAPARKSGVGRQNSFRVSEFRPPVDGILENMDDFFPDVDLDKPIIAVDEVKPSPAPSTTTVSPTTARKTRLARHQSMRIVAKRREGEIKRQSRLNPLPRVASVALDDRGTSALLRRKSTRMWDRPTQQVRPDELGTLDAPDPSADSFRWVKGNLIGKGSYGKVYLALNATTGDMLAVKQVELPRTSGDKDDERQTGVIAALKGEIETLRDLDHPHIVQYLGYEETVEHLSIFLEYVPGGSVGRCIRRYGKFEEGVVRSFTHQIIDGLAYLHQRDILHRDLKADNILLDLAGVCKISDFGVSKKANNPYEANIEMSMQGMSSSLRPR